MYNSQQKRLMSSRKNHPISTRLASVLVVSLVSIGIGAFTPVFASRPVAAPNAKKGAEGNNYTLTRPALVVGIFVEGLDADYVTSFATTSPKTASTVSSLTV